MLGLRKQSRYRIQYHSSRRRYNRRNALLWFGTICLENLPKRKWDQAVMFMFLCALFPFLHALLGIGGEVEQDMTRPVNATSEPPTKSENDTGEAAPLRNQLLERDTDTSYPVGDSEHLTRAPIAFAPQDAFPDPTSPVTHSEMTPTRSASTFAQTPEPSAPVWFQGDKKEERVLYGPFYLEFNGIPWNTATKAI
ncbi:uncharacterized protein EDB91DRAFT_1119516 [Suillus paluster]|uniref:uncharacterized protein n=1 Tax=Suillus paluster TaxID=48578 RepID=UPI001B87A27D|nr:uncharacterized protein EDB91DRAFT_1119516 [Suillus paluster]KAG1745923.1 hypothetical protein EDB91DRAFT_1119516 [Suillus paluster]